MFHGYLSIKDYGNASLNLQACNYISLDIFKALATVLLAQQVTRHIVSEIRVALTNNIVHLLLTVSPEKKLDKNN